MEQLKLHKWLESRYKSLYEEFGERKFTLEDALNFLENRHKDSKDKVQVLISQLRKVDLLHTDTDAKDSRRKIYRLHDRSKIIKETFSAEIPSLHRGDIDNLLKKAADLIRTRVDYKFILIMLFLKRISDKWEDDFERAYQEALKDGLNEKQSKQEAKSATYHDFDIPEEFLWDNIRKEVTTLPEKFSQAIKALAERNPELKDILDSVDFAQFTTNRENAEILRQLMELFSEKKLHHVSPDVLGDAYEWILKYFAPQKAKEGEVYTPREVIKLLVELLDPKPKESVYDPACGSGGMLIISYKHVEGKFGKNEARKLFLFGQEQNPQTKALARMNMYIHDIRDVTFSSGDTLLYPKFKEGESVRKFDVVIANPPWNQDGYDENIIKKGEFWKQRFSYGFVPRQSADWAWVQHMLASAREDTGRVGIVIDNGCLFRGGKEQAIRQKILDLDLLECVILLPEKLFYNTGAPGAIIILNKNKPKARKTKVLFINASQEAEQHPDVRKLNRLGEKNIASIVKAYNKSDESDGFARFVPLDEIKENDYNLNVTLYVFPEEEQEDIDLDKEWQELQKLDKERNKLDNKIEGFLKELG